MESKVLSWRTKPSFKCVGEEFPIDIADVATYFSGNISNIKPDDRANLRLSMHTPNSESRLLQRISEWCGILGCSLTKCIIKTDNFTCIGWLFYSSQYTDTEPL